MRSGVQDFLLPCQFSGSLKSSCTTVVSLNSMTSACYGLLFALPSMDSCTLVSLSPTPHSFDPSTTLLGSDITITRTTISLTLKSSKTDPFRKGCTIYIGSTDTSTCPISALRKYTNVTKTAPCEPLFQFRDGSYLTRTALIARLRALLTAAGHHSSSFSSHSFRIGAASTAADVGLPDWQIQTLGRWSSNCFTTYIRTDPRELAHASKQLATSTR